VLAVKAKPDNIIIPTFSKLAVARETRKIGNIMLNFTDRNSEKTKRELYIQALGIRALTRKMARVGYKKNRLGRKT
jgi:hypothetical protein